MADCIRIDVGGRVFKTKSSTLKNIPHTRLANLGNYDDSYDTTTNVFYFDRNSDYFEVILDCYRTGELHVPNNICIHKFEDELKYWGIPVSFISTCCRGKLIQYHSFRQTVENLHLEMSSSPGEFENDLEHLSQLNKLFRKVWLTMEFPDYSPIAKVWAIFVGISSLLSVAIVALYFHPIGRTEPEELYMENTDQFQNDKIRFITTTKPIRALVYVDIVLNIVLALDVMGRFILTPKKIIFLKSVLNWIDLLASLAYWVFLALVNNVKKSTTAEGAEIYTIRFSMILIVLRVFRILRLSNISKSLKIFIIVMKKNVCELSTLLLFFLISMMIFSLLIFQAELNNMNSFPDIKSAVWWTIITMTTVGYGDIVPQTNFGYVVAGICAINGILLCGLVIPIISNNFALYYAYAETCQEINNVESFKSSKPSRAIQIVKIEEHKF